MADFRPPVEAPTDLPGLIRYVMEQNQRIAQATTSPNAYLLLDVLYKTPAKPRPAMLVYADGVSWNPGAGEGVYRRNKGNTAWVFLG